MKNTSPFSGQPVLLVSDLDGTYLEPDGTLPPCALKFESVLQRRGVEFVVATSRSPHSVNALLRGTGRAFYALCSDGATTVRVNDTDWHVIGEIGLSATAAQHMADTMSKCHKPSETFVFASSQASFTIYHVTNDGRDESLRVLTEDIGERRPIQRISSLSEAEDTFIDGGVRAISWFAPEESITLGTAQISKEIEQTEVTTLFYHEDRYPSYWWLDVLDRRTNKATALAELLKSRRTRPRIIVLGNGDNDVRLFEVADVSFCPKDGSEGAKREATRVLDAPGGNAFIHDVIQLLEDDHYWRTIQ